MHHGITNVLVVLGACLPNDCLVQMSSADLCATTTVRVEKGQASVQE